MTTDKKNDLAVYIANGYKTYGTLWKSQTVLHDIGLNVPKGIIYGLLGPSGCGKTTLLRCIIGRLPLKSGEVIVYGKRPGSSGHDIPGRSVGFMPQETALYRNFTISEMLYYFGRLHHMKSKAIGAREDFLLSFLDLPSKSRRIHQLSGGQQRRVSLACALLQEPKLLILDEPTVGVDPLLREKIWSHLIDISKASETTILITTHYIEEARKANRVGLMRSGRILAEDAPSVLLERYNQTTLENVFLHLCYNDQTRIDQQAATTDTNRSFNISTEVINEHPPSPSNDHRSERNFKDVLSDYWRLPKLHKISALAIKDLTVIKRNIGFLLFQFLLPVLQVSLFCLCIGRTPEHLPMALFNNESLNGFPTGNFSLELLNNIDSTDVRFTSFNDFNLALNSVRQGDQWGLAFLNTNFTQAVKNKLLAFHTDPETLNASSIHLYLDMTNQQVSFSIQSVILNGTELFLKAILAEHKIDPSIVNPPVIIENPIYGDLTPKFTNFAAPGMMVSIIFFVSIGLTALLLVIEKKEGLLERSWSSGVTIVEIMLSHISVKFLTQVIQVVLMIIFAHLIFEVEIKGSIPLLMLLIFVQAICGMSYGLLISSFCSEEVQVMQVAMGSVLPMLLISGVIWPVEGMPAAMRVISRFTPLTHTVEAMRCIASRGWSFVYYEVWIAFVIIGAWSTGFFILAALLFVLKK